jgi:hypothetical protein
MLRLMDVVLHLLYAFRCLFRLERCQPSQHACRTIVCLHYFYSVLPRGIEHSLHNICSKRPEHLRSKRFFVAGRSRLVWLSSRASVSTLRHVRHALRERLPLIGRVIWNHKSSSVVSRRISWGELDLTGMSFGDVGMGSIFNLSTVYTRLRKVPG